MSGLTRARRGNYVTFRDASGKQKEGQVLRLGPDRMLVAELRGQYRRKVAVWEIPYVSVIEVHSPDYEAKNYASV